MDKFIPYEKLSKKEKRRLDSKKRRTWGGSDPSTRVIRSKKTYTRKQKHKGLPDIKGPGDLFLCQS